MRDRRGERGQSLLLAAIMVTVLIGFTGLAVDGGEASVQQQAVRNAADGAALAAAYDIFTNLSTEAAATTLAQDVVAADRLPTSDLTMSYLDSGGTATAIASNVVTVQAVVADSRPTYFVAALGIPTFQVKATAQAQGNSHAAPVYCGLCAMSASGAGVQAGTSASITVTGVGSGGGTVVDSTSNGEITLGKNASLAAAYNTIAGGTPSLGPGATLSPAAVVGAAQADPYPSLAAPSLSGSNGNYTAPAGSSSLANGVYNNVTVGAGSILTLDPGTFVVTGTFSVSGGIVIGSGVTLFLACSGYPVACPPAGAFGALISVSGGGSLALTPPTGGDYAGLTVFADRHNNSTSTASNFAAFSVAGTWYGIAMPVRDSHNGDRPSFGQLIVASLTLNNFDVVTVNRSGAIYGSVVGLSL